MLTKAVMGAADFKTVSWETLTPGAMFVHSGAICFATELAERGGPNRRAIVYLTGPRAFQLRLMENQGVAVLLLGNARDKACRIRVQLRSEPKPSDALNGDPRRGTLIFDEAGPGIWIQVGDESFLAFSLESFSQKPTPENVYLCWWAEGWKMTAHIGTADEPTIVELGDLEPPAAASHLGYVRLRNDSRDHRGTVLRGDDIDLDRLAPPCSNKGRALGDTWEGT